MTRRTEATPSNLSKVAIGAIAEKLSDEMGYSRGGSMSEIVSRMGGKVVVKDFWESANQTGALVVQGVGDFDVYIPSHTSYERDQFTIAHELGHYVLHFLYKRDDVSLPMYADRYGSGRVEWEANWFAGAFLMPKAMFVSIFNKLGGHLASVAREFNVSEEAARVRAKSLNLIPG